MYEEMMCYEYTIPLELIVRCKELIEVEKEQIEQANSDGYHEAMSEAIKEIHKYYKWRRSR
jgi:hypothetical protein